MRVKLDWGIYRGRCSSVTGRRAHACAQAGAAGDTLARIPLSAHAGALLL